MIPMEEVRDVIICRKDSRRPKRRSTLRVFFPLIYLNMYLACFFFPIIPTRTVRVYAFSFTVFRLRRRQRQTERERKKRERKGEVKGERQRN